MRQLYLHIGYPKTGTTAIQGFLYANREQLLEQNILYPDTGIENVSHHQIPWVFTEDYRRRSELGKKDIHEGLRRELGENPSVEKVIISSEGFIFGMKPEDVLNLFKYDFDQIKLITYIRQPFRWIRSDYNQGVKGWRQLTCSFDEHLDTVLLADNSPMDYFTMLSRWASVFGWNNIIARSYDIERFDLVNGFLRILDVHENSQFKQPENKKANPRLSTSQLELLRALNSFELAPEDRQWLFAQIQSIESVKINDSLQQKEGLNFHLDAALTKRVREINKSNKKLLPCFGKQVFDRDFFTLGSTEKKSLVDQLEIGRLAEIVRPLVAILLSAR